MPPLVPQRSLFRWVAGLLAAGALAAPGPAAAVELSGSGFATLGYARSDSPYRAQRQIDDGGTWRRDSLVAGQLDLSLAPRWSATAQVKLAPAENSETAWRARAAWAFLAWRPNNDWLLRVGRQRTPLYLHSESLDVGVTHDMARLPHEMYSFSPSNDFDGVSVGRSLVLAGRDIGIDAYAGQARGSARFWTRDGVAPAVAPGPLYTPVRIGVQGLVLTVRDPSLTWRFGLHQPSTRLASGAAIAVRYPRVDIAPGLGYWQVDDNLPGPGVPRVSRIRNLVVTAGAEWFVGGGLRLVGEVVKPFQRDTDLGSDATGGYLALFRTSGDLTSYVSIARQRSSGGVREWYQWLANGSLPAGVPGAAQINAAQRLAAETMYAFDQHSLALGASYALSPTVKLKGEWMRTWVGEMSTHFDTPPGQPDARGLRVDTWSFNLNVAF